MKILFSKPKKANAVQRSLKNYICDEVGYWSLDLLGRCKLVFGWYSKHLKLLAFSSQFGKCLGINSFPKVDTIENEILEGLAFIDQISYMLKQLTCDAGRTCDVRNVHLQDCRKFLPGWNTTWRNLTIGYDFGDAFLFILILVFHTSLINQNRLYPVLKFILIVYLKRILFFDDFNSINLNAAL